MAGATLLSQSRITRHSFGLPLSKPSNPTAAAAARAVMRVMDEEGIRENCHAMGEVFKTRLGKLCTEMPQVPYRSSLPIPTSPLLPLSSLSFPRPSRIPSSSTFPAT